MFIRVFFSWWYKDGWAQVAASLNTRVASVSAAFSVNQLFSTLFAPWRRIISYPGASLSDKLQAWADNLFSRTVGFIVRLIVLFTALLVTIAVAFLTLLELVLWPLLPLGIIGCVIAGLIC